MNVDLLTSRIDTLEANVKILEVQNKALSAQLDNVMRVVESISKADSEREKISKLFRR